VSLARFEPALLAPEASTLSIELQGQRQGFYHDMAGAQIDQKDSNKYNINKVNKHSYHIMKNNPVLHTLQFVLLGFLEKGPDYGYELYKKICDPRGVGMLWRMKTSQIYVMLDDLVGRGYCTARLIRDSRRPVRREYAITKSGSAAFLNWRRQPVVHPRDIRLSFLARYYFARIAGAKEPQDLVIAQIEESKMWKESLARRDINGDSSFVSLVRNYRAIQIDGILEWLNSLLLEKSEK
jgi:PadR family transcriptional regulator AphA